MSTSSVPEDSHMSSILKNEKTNILIKFIFINFQFQKHLNKYYIVVSLLKLFTHLLLDILLYTVWLFYPTDRCHSMSSLKENAWF